MQGYISLVLHAHLPFVRHPEHEKFLEENWLFEAITETYLPLLNVLQGWERDGMQTPLTLCLSPTLCAMLRDPLLPTSLLPADWPGRAARALCGEIYRALLPASEQWLDRHATNENGPLPKPGAELFRRFDGV